MRILTAFVFLLFVNCTVPSMALSRVIVYDLLALTGHKVMLKAETRGRFFAKGGELVTFFIDGNSIGKNLSGGDGVAFKVFTPVKGGLHQIKAVSRVGKGTGILLSIEKETEIVFVDVEGQPAGNDPLHEAQAG